MIVLGRPDERITRMPWMERRPHLWPVVRDALHELLGEYEQLVIEGAGSPAEVNLRASDIVNMAVALECAADVYLVSDIDRGGSFAHLLGTWMCLTADERARVRGFVLNRFRGDPTLLGDAPAWLERQTGVPVVATVPYLRHALPEEDAFHHGGRFVPGAINVALVLYPWASNLDEFDPLFHEDGVNVVPVQRAQPLDAFDAVMLPGSKSTVQSLAHLRASGPRRRDRARGAPRRARRSASAAACRCSARAIHDPTGSRAATRPGSACSTSTTTLAAEKTTRWTEVAWRDGDERARLRDPPRRDRGRARARARRSPAGSAGRRAACRASTCTGCSRTPPTVKHSSRRSAGAAARATGPACSTRRSSASPALIPASGWLREVP